MSVTLEDIQEIFNRTVGRTDIILTPKTKLADVIEVTSFGMIQLVLAIEDAYDIEIPNTMLKKIKKVQDVLDYLSKIL